MSEIIPPGVGLDAFTESEREIERQRLSRFEAWLLTGRMNGTTKYTESQISYVLATIRFRRSLMDLDEVNFDRKLQLERFKLFPQLVEIMREKVHAEVQQARTAHNDAKAFEEKRVWERLREAAEAEQKYDDFKNPPAPPPPLPPFPTAEGTKKPSQNDEEFEKETELLLAGTRKTDEFNKRWTEYANTKGGWPNLTPEDQARYEKEKRDLDQLLKRYHRA